MLKSLLLICLLLMLGSTKKVWAVEFHGFVIEGFDSQSNRMNTHLRLVFQEKVGETVSARLTLTPEGPLDNLTYYELIWKRPIKGVEELVIGRTFPPFGREWFLYRADEIPTLIYSGSNGPLSVADTGVTVRGKEKRAEWWLGGYIGDRTFGNERRFEGGGNAYARIEYSVNSRLEIGSSYRTGPKETAGLDLYYYQGKTMGILETVRSERKNRLALIGIVGIGRSGYVVRAEVLNPGTRWTVAVPYRFSKDIDFSVGYLFGPGQTGMMVARLAGRW